MRNKDYMARNYKILAEKFMDEGDSKRALDFYMKAYNTKGGSTDIELLLDMAVYYDELMKEEHAVQKYKEVLELDPEEARAYYGLAIIHDDKGEYEQAIELYKRAIELDPEYGRAYFFLANAYDESGSKENAIENYRKVLELEPDDFWANVNLGVIYEEMNKNEEAYKLMKAALELDPEHYKAQFNMGVILKKLGRLEEAKEYYYMSINEECYYPYSYLNLGVMYIEEKEYKRAISVFTEGISNNPEAASLHYNRACCYAQLGAPEKALKDIIKALEIYPELEEFMKSDKELDEIRKLDAYKKYFE